MSRVSDGTTNNRLDGINAAPLNGGPATMACWFYVEAYTANRTMMSIGSDAGASDDWWRLSHMGAVAGDPIRSDFNNTGGTSAADTTTGVSSGTAWHHACGTCDANNNTTAYLDGGNKGLGALNNPNDIGSDAHVVIQGLLRGSGAYLGGIDGAVAHPCIWNVQLSDAEVATLAKGVHPLLVRPEAIVFYAPFDDGAGDARDVVGGVTLTEVGTVSEDVDPPIYYPQSQITGLTAAAAAPAGTRPQNPLGHPFAGPFAGPIG